MIGKVHSKLSISKQCKLLSVHRSGLYYKPRAESNLNLEPMRLMDGHYTYYCFKGPERIHTWLTMNKGYKVNQKRIERLYYDVMGLRAVMPGRRTSKRNRAHKIYPYLLRNLKVEHPNQVWATDITYVPMEKGFMYLTAIIHLHSRYVVNRSVTNTMDAQWCADTLRQAMALHGKPEIVNTDQGSQFTFGVFTDDTNNIELDGITIARLGAGYTFTKMDDNQSVRLGVSVFNLFDSS